MFSFLKDHPFAVSAHFDRSLVLTFAAPKEELQQRIPDCLELDTYEGKWAFVAMALVQTRNLRPKGFPAWMGNDFFLIGYRVFVRYHTNEGKRLRGLFILKSETDKKKMEFFGNIFTHYSYTTSDISHSQRGRHFFCSSRKSDFEIEVELSNGESTTELPALSPFTDWKQARRFAGPLPFTFTFQPEKKELLIIEGVRENWTPKPVHVVKQRIAFIDSLGLNNCVLANAFEITDIPYWWKKGRKEIWNGRENTL